MREELIRGLKECEAEIAKETANFSKLIAECKFEDAAELLPKINNFAVEPCMSDLDENGDIIPYSEEDRILHRFNDDDE